jgi:hypothetical protein
MEQDVGLDMNKQEHTRILEWFMLPESKTLCPLFCIALGSERVTKLEKACMFVSV